MRRPANRGTGRVVRSTRQKRAVAAVLEDTRQFRSAQDIYAALRAAGDPVGLTTVYNQLRALAADGQIDAVRTDSGESLYRRCASAEHHHHAVCRECGLSVEVAGPAVEQWAAQVARETGFSDVRHTVEITGRCADCAR